MHHDSTKSASKSGKCGLGFWMLLAITTVTCAESRAQFQFHYKPIIREGMPPTNIANLNITLNVSAAGLVFGGRNAEEPTNSRFYLWDGAEITEFAAEGDDPGEFLSLGFATINDSGTIALSAVPNDENRASVFVDDGSSRIRIFDGVSNDINANRPSINNAGHVAFSVGGSNDRDIYLWNGKSTNTILVKDESFLDDIGEIVVLSDSGFAYIHGRDPQIATFPDSYRVDSKGNVEFVLDAEGTFLPDVNAIDDYVTVRVNSGVTRVRGDFQQTETLASTKDGFTLLGQRASTNARRDVVFRGFDPSGGIFIYRGFEIAAVARVGDTVAGTNLTFADFGAPVIDDRGRIFFGAFAGGGLGIYVATIMGDSDFDGDVDEADFAFFQRCFGGEIPESLGAPPSDECIASFDFDGDGDIDLDDYESLLNVTNGPCTSTPLITTHPTDQEVGVGEMATFTVAAIGENELSYQWSFFDDEIPGATDAQLIIEDPSPLEAGVYRVRVSDGCSSVSSFATLTVGGPQAFTWNVATGEWGNPANWTPAGIPSVAGDSATIDNGGNVSVMGQFSYGDTNVVDGTLAFTDSSDVLTSDLFLVGGNDAPARIESTGGGSMNGPLQLRADGSLVVADGVLTQDGPSITADPGSLMRVESSAAELQIDSMDTFSNGSVEVEAGGLLEFAGRWWLDGIASIDSSTVRVDSNAFVGASGEGEVTLTGLGAQLEVNFLIIADDPGSSGTINVNDGAILECRTINLGEDGDGQVVVNDAIMRQSQDGLVSMAVQSTSSGTVRIENGAEWQFDRGNFQIGRRGVGSVVIDGAGTSLSFSGDGISLSAQPGGQGSMTVSNGASVQVGTNAGTTFIGEYGIGTWTVDSGSTVDTAGNGVFVGGNQGGEGTLSVLENSQFSMTGQNNGVNIGRNGIGHLIVDGAGSSFTTESNAEMRAGDIMISGGGSFDCGGILEITGGEMTVTGTGSSATCTGLSMEIDDTVVVQSGAAFSVTNTLFISGTLKVTGASFDGNLTSISGIATCDNATVAMGSQLTINGSLESVATTFSSPTVSIGVDGAIVDDTSAPSTIDLSAFANASQMNESWETRETTLRFSGTDAVLEAASSDLGAVQIGYVDNFALGTVELTGSSTTLTLIDDEDNVEGAEAVYIGTLVIPTGTTLDLAGLKLYVETLDQQGTVLLNGGTLEIVNR